MTIQLNNGTLRLFSCCKVVVGATRAIVADLNRHSFCFIPREIGTLFSLSGHKTIEQCLDLCSFTDHDLPVLQEWIEKLLETEYAFLDEFPDLEFLEISEEVDRFSKLTNAIIDIDDASSYDISGFVETISENMCQAVLVRVFKPVNLASLHAICELFNNTTIREVQLLFPFASTFQSPEEVFTYFKGFPRVQKLIIFSAPHDQHVWKAGAFEVLYSTDTYSDESHCGIIDPSIFTTNLDFFNESRQYNNCLYGKVSIDKTGHLCSCPGLPQKFGRFDRNVGISHVFKQAEYLRLSKVTKDQVNTCRDCEFRYICHDCRLQGGHEVNKMDKPKTCTYDPYNATWH